MGKKRVLALLLAFCMALGLSGAALAEGDDGIMLISTEQGAAAPAPGEAKPGEEAVVLFTNDVHCGVDANIGYAGLVAYANEMREAYGEEYVTLVDAGDSIQGDVIGTLSRGEYLVEIMNEVGYTLSVPGNHEFDYGMDRFLELAEKAEYDYVSANLVDLTTGEPLFDAYKLVNYGETTVAFVGISTPETFFKSTPAYFKNEAGEYIYSFCEGNDGAELYAAVQTAIDGAKEAGADYVIAVGHLGIEEDSAPWRSTDVIANTTGLTAFIDAHSHSEIFGEIVEDKDGQEVVLAQTGTKLANIGKFVINLADGSVAFEMVSGYEAKDEATAAFVGSINDEFKDLTNQVVAHTSVELITHDADGNRLIRTTETNIGDLCADAYRIMSGADVGVMNGGGIRASLPVDHTDPESDAYIEGAELGDITYGDIIAVFPWGNYLSVVEATGQQIADLLEMGVSALPGELGGFQHVSGLTYTVDCSIPSGVKTNDKGEFEGVEGARRVTSIEIGGEPIDLEKTYTIASHDYLLDNAGDGMTMFEGCASVQEASVLDYQMLIEFITDTLGGEIGEQYADKAGEGRISIANRDVDPTSESASSISAVYAAGIMVGDGDGNFRPASEVIAAELCQVLYNMSDRPEVETDDPNWFAPAMTWAAETGLYTETDAFDTISGEELSEIIGMFAELSEVEFSAGELGGEAITRAELADVLCAFSAAE